MSERLIKLKRMFREKPLWHVDEIANELGVARTKVYALRDQLRRGDGIWLEENKFNNDVPPGHLRWPQNHPLREIHLSSVEVEALKTAIEQMDAVTPLVRRALEELTHDQPIKDYLGGDSVIHIPLSDDFNKALFARVIKAIREQKPAQVRYLNSSGILKDYEFYSYVLIPSGQHLHLVGMSKTSKDAGYSSVNRLRLDQIQDFTLLKGQFPKPDFSVEAYVDKHFGPFSGEGEPVRVRVWFSQEKAQYIRRTTRHLSQQTFDQDGGGVIWQIDAPLSDYLVTWIASYGPHARVLEPRELTEKVVAWAEGCVDANR